MMRGRELVNRLAAIAALFLLLAPAATAQDSDSEFWNRMDQDGYDLWLRYVPLDEGAAHLVDAFDPFVSVQMSPNG